MTLQLSLACCNAARGLTVARGLTDALLQIAQVGWSAAVERTAQTDRNVVAAPCVPVDSSAEAVQFGETDLNPVSDFRRSQTDCPGTTGRQYGAVVPETESVRAACPSFSPVLNVILRVEYDSSDWTWSKPVVET